MQRIHAEPGARGCESRDLHAADFTVIAFRLSLVMSSPASLLRDVRARAALSQRRLAELAVTTQSVVARIELGIVSPGVQTLTDLLAAAGFELQLSAQPTAPQDTHMLDDVDRILALSPANRLRELANASRFFARATRV